mmetsp:Transcript_19084/g.26690  ORF Transcript_19084/g.26690 Transcript_19084/m.26690 type:complete len:648 (+) Transcript_19084:95-2038(+)|eukprot:CAMPEP_0184488818 /NCGR_PEP_ID=MMETSP0113_2-20130426/13547_1 /TAXON_ID=91329 /ORGANISM="Norrisiella sphaerica, Strain BC52" /LENGTH=647 /DNA_ID=CAMNT_0026871867 /DNA_START=33 /DNA_END=1976 /DNA_ORIENTATION=+
MRLSLFTLLPLVAFGANPVTRPIQIEPNVEIHVRKFAELPLYEGEPSRINSISEHNGDIYVSTDRSGSLMYKIDSSGNPTLWFDVANAVITSVNRSIDTTDFVHGGLRGFAIHPDFANNGKFYTSFMETRPSDPQNFNYLSDSASPSSADSVVVEWTAVNGVPDPTSYRQVIRIGMPVYDHPIKQIVFYGNYLYIGHGDGSVDSTIVGGGQGNDALGKILRIDPLQDGSNPYSIPPDNPFVGDSTYLDEIYAVGFNNPHTLCFSHITGDLFVAEAARDNVEEINIVKSGKNYGWPLREGPFLHLDVGGLITGIAPLPANDSDYGFTYPNAVVGHEGQVGDGYVGQAIAGGCPLENGSPLSGRYFYSDFPLTGKLYYSYTADLKVAVTEGNPDQLTQAFTYQSPIFYDQDNDEATPPLEFDDLGSIVKYDINNQNSRADIRFGRGADGEMYFSSKKSGALYLVTNSVVPDPASQSTLRGELVFSLPCNSPSANGIEKAVRRALANAASVSEDSVTIVRKCVGDEVVLDFTATMDSTEVSTFRASLQSSTANTLGSIVVSEYGIPEVKIEDESDDNDEGFSTVFVIITVVCAVVLTIIVALIIYLSFGRDKGEKIPAQELSVMTDHKRKSDEVGDGTGAENGADNGHVV